MSLFCCRSKFNRFFDNPISEGIELLISLKDKSRLERLVQRPRVGGIGPLNLLLLRLKIRRFFKFPSSLEMEPHIRLEEMLKVTN